MTRGRTRTPTWKRFLFVGVAMAMFLGLVEGVLTVGPRLWVRARRGADTVGETTLVCIGDSVTEGDGLAAGNAYPAQLRRMLDSTGRGDVGVVSRADPGAAFDVLGPRLAREVSATPGRRVHLVLLGHNDVVHWAQLNPFRSGAPTGEPTLVTAPPRWQPRIVRVFEWGLGAVRRDVPLAGIDPRVRTEIPGRLRRYMAELPPADVVYLLTYVIPGRAPPGMDAHLAAIIDISRASQIEGNELLREAAETTGARLLDLERVLSFGDVWSDEWFQDDIHLTARGYARMSAEILRELELRGELD